MGEVRDGSATTSTCCSCKGSRFNSQHPRGGFTTIHNSSPRGPNRYTLGKHTSKQIKHHKVKSFLNLVLFHFLKRVGNNRGRSPQLTAASTYKHTVSTPMHTHKYTTHVHIHTHTHNFKIIKNKKTTYY